LYECMLLQITLVTLLACVFACPLVAGIAADRA
jgi:hypothetical protein